MAQHGLGLALLWLWCRPAATAPIGPLPLEPPYAVGAAQENGKKTKKNESGWCSKTKVRVGRLTGKILQTSRSEMMVAWIWPCCGCGVGRQQQL